MNPADITKKYVPGLRIIKTSLAVFICLFVFFSFDYYTPINAVIVCVLMMKTSVDESFVGGINRTIGTVLGGAIALLMLELMRFFIIDIESLPAAFIIAAGILIALTISKSFNWDSSVGSTACVVLLILMLSHGHASDEPFAYITKRVIETLLGLLIAVLVNRYFNPKILFKNQKEKT